MNLIIYAIPFFFLFIGVELLITKMRKLSYYRFNDAVTNLSLGIGSTVTGVFLKTLTVLVYIKLYEISPLNGTIPNTWWVYLLLFLGADFFLLLVSPAGTRNKCDVGQPCRTSSKRGV